MLLASSHYSPLTIKPSPHIDEHLLVEFDIQPYSH